MPDSWEWVRLDSVGDIVTGSTPPKDNKEFYGGDIPFYKPTDLEQGINTTTSTDSLTEEGFAVARQLPTDSILVTCIGATIGKTGMIRKAGTCNQQINAIVSFPSVFPDYIYYVCISDFMQSNIKDNASATTLPILNKNHFAELQIPLPPIEEQKRIVAAIEKWCTLIDTLETLKDNLHISIAQAKSKILDLAIHGRLVPQDPNDEPAIELLKRINPNFTPCDNAHYPYDIPKKWEWTNLGEITNYGNCENVDVNDIPKEGWVLELEDLEKDSAKIIQRLSKDERDIKGVRHTFHKGDVLYSKLRTYLNKVMVAPEDGFCTTEIIPVTCMSFIQPEYLNHVLRSKYFVYYTIQCGYGVKMPRLSTSDARNGQIPLPPYKEQLRIVAKIQELFSVLDKIEESIKD